MERKVLMIEKFHDLRANLCFPRRGRTNEVVTIPSRRDFERENAAARTHEAPTQEESGTRTLPVHLLVIAIGEGHFKSDTQSKLLHRLHLIAAKVQHPHMICTDALCHERCYVASRHLQTLPLSSH